jgi:hypothetical protein
VVKSFTTRKDNPNVTHRRFAVACGAVCRHNPRTEEQNANANAARPMVASW